MKKRPILVTGSSGKLGQVLRKVWPEAAALNAAVLWQSRSGLAPDDIIWDIATETYAGPSLAGGVVLHLAGGRRDLDSNARLALRVCEEALRSGAQHVFLASSSAVYAPDESADIAEDSPLAPLNDYGDAKAQMEDEVSAWAAARRGAPGITFLRIGNVFGADSLIGNAKPGIPVRLTPVPGRPGGPLRSYIGPRSFADALGQLCMLAINGTSLPRILNIGLSPAVSMAGLLDAAGIDWTYDEANPAGIPRLVLSVDRLMSLVQLAPDAALPATMFREWQRLRGEMP